MSEFNSLVRKGICMNQLYNSYFFNEFYEKEGGGNYMNKEVWLPYFENIAEKIIANFSPKTVLDAGCACGYLVEALRNRGVEAYGVDISSYAIEHVSPEIKEFCCVHNIADPLPSYFPQKYDLVVTIEVLEHLYEEDGKQAIANLCSYSDKIIFTSTPDDISDQSHVNVQKAEYWCRIFAQNSFYRNLFQAMDWICPWAMFFEKRTDLPNLVDEYERKLRLEQNVAVNQETLIRNLREKEDNQSEYLRNLLKYHEDQQDSKNEKIVEITCELERRNQAYSNLLDLYRKEQSQTQYFKTLFDGISQSTVWKMSKPIRGLADKFKRRTDQNKHSQVASSTIGGSDSVISEPQHLLAQRNIDFDSLFTGHKISAIDTIIVNDSVKRLNLVTDTIESSSLLGGVATALIIATKFAEQFNYELRIITRTTTINPLNYQNIIKLNGLTLPKKVSYYSDCGNEDFKLELSPNDVFLATSWWSAAAIKKTSLRTRFFYILQEVETFFYPHGVEHYLCSRIMKDQNIDFIVNSHYLYDYFKVHESNIVENGICFEPAFSRELYQPGDFEKKEKYKLFFYARPNNPRNLYSYGYYLLNLAAKNGVIDSKRWEIYFAGQEIDSVCFDSNIIVHCLGQLSWEEYTVFLRKVDLAVSLMYTPHPSYPPYDVACSGGVVVTNKCFNKVSMPECKNIIVTDLEEDAFMDSLTKGIHLAENMFLRKENFVNSSINRVWDEALQGVLDFMGEKVKHV